MTLAWMHFPQPDANTYPPVFQGSTAGTSTLDVPSKVIILGTSTGHIQVHGPSGQLLHRQRLHNMPVLGIQVAHAHAPATMKGCPLHECATIVVSFRCAICSISSEAISSVLHRLGTHIGAGKAQGSRAPLQAAAFRFIKWGMPAGTKDRSDAACIPSMHHLWEDVVELQERREANSSALLSFVAVGVGPAVTLFESRDSNDAVVPILDGRVDVLEASKEGGMLQGLVNNVAGMVLGHKVDAAADIFGLSLPGCTSYTADTVNAIIGAKSFTWPELLHLVLPVMGRIAE
jgi:hypothetical protein